MSVLIDKIKQFKWVPTSREDLACAEDALLANIHGQFYHHTVRTPQCEINTISSVAPGSPSEKKDVVLLLHGFGFGCVQWAAMAQIAEVHAIDMPGFGRSGHPVLHSNISSSEALIFLIQVVEEWMKAALLNTAATDNENDPRRRVILVGHSFGGYVAGKFAVNYPHRVKKLILIDPFGLDVPPQEQVDGFWDGVSRKERLKIWAAKRVFYNIGTPNMLRALGPYGADILKNRKGAVMAQKWSHVLSEPQALADYIYHANVHGESGWFLLSKLVHGIGAGIGEGFHILLPLREDLTRRLSPEISLDFILGARSWIPHLPAQTIVGERDGHLGTTTRIVVVPNAGHHVYVDQHDVVNELLARWIQDQTPTAADSEDRA